MEKENGNSNAGAGLFIMIGLIVSTLLLGFAFKMGFNSLKQFDRVVSVKGLCEQEVKADRVISPFVYKEGGDNLPQMYQNVKEKNRIIINFLKKAGIAETEITVSAPKVVDTRTEWSGNQNAYNYIITSIITVCTDKVDTILKLQSEQGELMEAGIATASSWEYQTTYEFTKLNDIKPQMIEVATKNARSAAEKFAADSDSKLGKIKRATQGQFSITERDSNTPYMKNVRVVTNVDYYLKD